MKALSESNPLSKKRKNLTIFMPKLLIICLVLVIFFSTHLDIISNGIGNISAYASIETNQKLQEIQSYEPKVDAKTIYDTGTATLGSNVKNLIILIPDEAHHGNGEAIENRFIVQSFLPQTTILNKGTKVIWFSGDVSHEHKIILTDKSHSVNTENPFDSGQIAENSNSNPMIFNTLGDFEFISPNVSPEAVQKGFVMKGEVKVVDQSNKLLPSNISNNNSTRPNVNKEDIQTIGVYMVPTKDLDSYISDFQNKGFSIDSTHTFTDVRGIARGTNSQQSLLVWTASSTMSLDSVISALKEITPTLPYK